MPKAPQYYHIFDKISWEYHVFLPYFWTLIYLSICILQQTIIRPKCIWCINDLFPFHIFIASHIIILLFKHLLWSEFCEKHNEVLDSMSELVFRVTKWDLYSHVCFRMDQKHNESEILCQAIPLKRLLPLHMFVWICKHNIKDSVQLKLGWQGLFYLVSLMSACMPNTIFTPLIENALKRHVNWLLTVCDAKQVCVAGLLQTAGWCALLTRVWTLSAGSQPAVRPDRRNNAALLCSPTRYLWSFQGFLVSHTGFALLLFSLLDCIQTDIMLSKNST